MTMRITKKGRELADTDVISEQVNNLLKFLNMTDEEYALWSGLETREEVKEFLKQVEPYDLGRKK
jgi:hypothetical protein